MDSFTLNLNRESLLDLMKDFNLLTGIKIALFDADGNEILSYPEEHCPFCKYIRSSKLGEEKCILSNIKSFKRCQKSASLEIFTCHAGLIETAAPLLDNGVTIGYIMFGQLTNNSNSTDVSNKLRAVANQIVNSTKGVDASIYSANYKTNEQIQAAAKILEACTFYILLKDMVSVQRKTFISNLNSFLMDHLSEDLSIDRLTSEFHISKNKLYDSCNKFLPTGIAEHIKLLRIEEAKHLLKETDLSVIEISDKVGFNDYNYFCRVFKKNVGISATKYRKS